MIFVNVGTWKFRKLAIIAVGDVYGDVSYRRFRIMLINGEERDVMPDSGCTIEETRRNLLLSLENDE